MEASLQAQFSQSTLLFMSTSFSSSCSCLRTRHRQSKASTHTASRNQPAHEKQRLALENCLPLKDPYSPNPSCRRCVHTMGAPRVFVHWEPGPLNEKRDTHIPRKHLINWQADISEFIIIKQTSFCSPTTILANPSSQATNLRDLSYKYSPNQNKWLKALRELKAIRIYIRGTDAI